MFYSFKLYKYFTILLYSWSIKCSLGKHKRQTTNLRDPKLLNGSVDYIWGTKYNIKLFQVLVKFISKICWGIRNIKFTHLKINLKMPG